MIVNQPVLQKNACFAEADFTVFQVGLINPRGEDRYVVGMTTPSDLIFPATGERLQAWLYDISPNGLGITLGQAVEVGLQLVIRLKIAETGKSLHLTGQVVRVTPTDNSTWFAGCTLATRLTGDVLDYFLT